MGDVWEEGRLQHALVSLFWAVLCPRKRHWEAVVIPFGMAVAIPIAFGKVILDVVRIRWLEAF